ncbi:MAG TPA: hypothetical protein VFD37_06895 [Solirubrobacterales bacterium]|nr:hypothetical protein [Solirubrobacterales bacterium]
MADQAIRKVEIGVEGGQVVPARLADEDLKTLRAALESERRWIDLETDGGTLSLDLDRVIFLRIGATEHRVGF